MRPESLTSVSIAPAAADGPELVPARVAGDPPWAGALCAAPPEPAVEGAATVPCSPVLVDIEGVCSSVAGGWAGFFGVPAGESVPPTSGTSLRWRAFSMKARPYICSATNWL